MSKNETEIFYPKRIADWRAWLQKNHMSKQAVWLVYYNKKSGIESISWSEAVDQALCFGWIDSKPNKRDEQSYYQFFAKRNPKSNWSKVNKDKVAKLLEGNKISKAGLKIIEIAKKNGAWNALDEVDKLTMPSDLKLKFDTNAKAFLNWESFPRSSRRGILEWILNAKRPETRQKRIDETVALAEKNIKANHYRQ